MTNPTSEQLHYILQMRKAIKDYCEASRKISPSYRPEAMNQCLEEIIIQSTKVR